MKVKLKEICEIQSGGTPNRSNKQYWDNGTINWAKISDIKDKYLFNTEEKITEEGLKNSSAKLFKKNSILYTIFATLGEACILGIDTTTNQAIANLEIRDKNVETEYIYYYLLSKKKLISGIGRGVAQNNINLSILKEMEINLADITTQKRIVDILNQNESIINKYKKQIALLDTLIKARFVEMFGDIELNDKNFKIVNFEDCIEYIGDIGSNGANKVVVDHLDMKDEEDYALLVRFLNFTNNDFKNNVKYISKEAYNFFKKSQIFGGELIFCKIGSAGLNYIMPYLNRPVSLGLNQIMIRIKGDINILYLHNYLNLPYGKKLIENCINGAVTKSITKTEIKKIPILLPPIELQNQFATFVKQVDKLKFDVQKSLEKTQMLFDSLMQEYFK